MQTRNKMFCEYDIKMCEFLQALHELPELWSRKCWTIKQQQRFIFDRITD